MITVVAANSGRCGSSLTMQMLQAAGVPLYWNRLPNRTSINPFGHYELDWERWHAEHERWLVEAEGHAIKLFLSKLRSLPETHDYQFIELRRDPENMFDSQTVMLTEENRLDERANPSRTVEGIQSAQEELATMMQGRRHITVYFHELFDGTGPEMIAAFLNLDALAIAKMRECVEPSLWHFKPKA